MGRFRASSIAVSLALALALGAAACGGGSDLLPGTTASEINTNLDRVRELVAENDCAGAEEAVEEVRVEVESLQGVDGELQEALSDAASHLGEVVSGCEEEPEETEEPNEELEELEKAEEAEEKPKKHERNEEAEKNKPEKEEPQPAEENEPPGHEKQEETEPPAEENEPPSGGIGPGQAVE